MRTPQRNFVVEFKSRRRQQNPSTHSIWGRADLKALAREVEEEASHLFSPSERDAGAPEQAFVASSLVDEGFSHERGDEPKVAILAPEATRIETPHDHRAGPLSREALAHSDETSPTLPRREKSVRKARGKAMRPPAKDALLSSPQDLHHDKIAPDTFADWRASVDELDALEIENRRLRALLAERLHNENRQLRAMLGRFGISV